MVGCCMSRVYNLSLLSPPASQYMQMLPLTGCPPRVEICLVDISSDLLQRQTQRDSIHVFLWGAGNSGYIPVSGLLSRFHFSFNSHLLTRSQRAALTTL